MEKGISLSQLWNLVLFWLGVKINDFMFLQKVDPGTDMGTVRFELPWKEQLFWWFALQHSILGALGWLSPKQQATLIQVTIKMKFLSTVPSEELYTDSGNIRLSQEWLRLSIYYVVRSGIRWSRLFLDFGRPELK